jgi:hypothetical protein
MTETVLPDGQLAFEEKNGYSASVVVERPSIEADLLDLSQAGARLSVSASISIQEALRLRIEIPELGLDLDIPAAVCWTRPSDGGSWIVGCSFSPELPEDAAKQLGVNGQLNRRKEPRFPIDVEGLVELELAEKNVPVRIRDYSAGGFCMFGSTPANSGQRLLLHVTMPDGTDVAIPGKVQWRFGYEDGYLFGCAYLNHQGYSSFRAIAQVAQKKKH